MDNNIDNNVDFGRWTTPKSWDEVTLGKFQEIERLYDGDGKPGIRDIIAVLCGKSADEVNSLPLEFLGRIMEDISFIEDRPADKEPTNKVDVGGETYSVHTENKLRVGEYVAVDTAMKADRHNYAAILAILCRKENEVYDSRFENEVLGERIRMWEQVPVTDVLEVVDFFLQLYVVSQSPTLLSSQAREAIELTRRNIGTLRQNGEISRRSMKSAMKELKRLEKSISSI